MATGMKAFSARRRDALPPAARQKLVVAGIADLNAETRLYTLEGADGVALAPSEAGCSLPVFVELGGVCAAHPNPMASSPRDADAGFYQIAVKRGAGGYASTRIFESWQVGDAIVAGAPRETELHRLVDQGGRVVALVAGMGVVAVRSLGKALAEGEDRYALTVLYAAKTPDDLLFRDEWARFEGQSGGSFKLVPVLASGSGVGCEPGIITLNLVRYYVDAESASFHICGPGPFVAALRKELAPLKLSRARLRSSFSGDTVYLRRPGGTSAHRLTVRIGGEVRCVPAREDETILTALERAGLQPEASCRSSICGLCSATILSGSYILATDEAGERKMDVRHGLIHPCCSYPVSDMEIIVPRVRNQPTLSKKEWCEVLLEAAQDVGGVEPELPERHSPRAGLV